MDITIIENIKICQIIKLNQLTIDFIKKKSVLNYKS